MAVAGKARRQLAAAPSHVTKPPYLTGCATTSSPPRLCRGGRFAFQQGDYLGAKQKDHDDNFDAEQGDDSYGDGTVNHIDHGYGRIIPDQHAPRYLPEGCSGDAADERVPEADAGNGHHQVKGAEQQYFADHPENIQRHARTPPRSRLQPISGKLLLSRISIELIIYETTTMPRPISTMYP